MMQMIYDGIQVQIEPLSFGYAMYNGNYGLFESIPQLPRVDLCFYCGSFLKESTERCPNCGAGDWKRRRRG